MGVFKETFSRFIVEGLRGPNGSRRIVKRGDAGLVLFPRGRRQRDGAALSVCGEFTDPATGSTHRVLLETYKSENYYGEYRDANGRLRKKAFGPDKEGADSQLRALKDEMHRVRAGLDAPRDEKRDRLRPLSVHLATYLGRLSRLGRKSQHIENVRKHVAEIAAGAGFETLRDVAKGEAVDFLDRLHFGEADADEPGVEPIGLSLNTCRAYCGSLKAFLNWALEEGLIAKNPLHRYVYRKGKKAVKTRERRALSSDEFARLIHAAAASDRKIESTAGADRAMLYILACWTGLRRSELGSLTADSFNFVASHPTVKVLAAYSKRGRDDVIALHPELVPMVNAWLASKGDVGRGEPVLPLGSGKSKRKTAKMMRLDLEAARRAWLREARAPLAAARDMPRESRTAIVRRVRRDAARRREMPFLQYRNADGLFADFHAHRVAFITNLNRAGVAPRIVQQLARHSDIRLTMGVYTALEIADQFSGIQALGAPPRLPGEATEASAAKLSGTDGRPLETDLPARGAPAPVQIQVRAADRTAADNSASAGVKNRESDSGTLERLADASFVSASDWTQPDEKRVAKGTRTLDPQIHNLEVDFAGPETPTIYVGGSPVRYRSLDELSDEELAAEMLRRARGRPVDRDGDVDARREIATRRLQERPPRSDAAG